MMRRRNQNSNPEVPNLCLIRAPIMPLLDVEQGPKILIKPFKSPLDGHVPGVSVESIRKTLGCRVRLTNIYTSKDKKFKSPPILKELEEVFPPFEPLILFSPPPGCVDQHEICVDPLLARWLREHQRLGVKFVFDCLMGFKEFEGNGCILADDMGLGKTLQSITILWTLLKQGIDGKPAVRKAVVICPASLINNWASEIDKWLKGSCPCTPVSDNCKEKTVSKFRGFKYDRQSLVLISSYETFRGHVDKLEGVPIDLIICDEAHRLKNDRTKTAVAIMNMKARKRLLLSGTPIQNDLDEFFSLVSMCNPDVFGDATHFRKTFANPILIGREPDATVEQQTLASERLAELSAVTNKFILRRTNALLAKVLPPKIMMNVFCRLSPLQHSIYSSFLESQGCQKLLQNDVKGGMSGKVLSIIQGLMKLCNHPSLIRSQTHVLPGFESCQAYLNELEKPVNNGGGRFRSCNAEISGKLLFLSRLLRHIRQTTNDRIVLISNYTQTLDLFDRLCKENFYPVVRLDGSTSIKRRHAIVTSFNNPESNNFVFLLSSKAGGCGINLIGANRLVMYDPDWNPANDKQALARVWRDGQKKVCYIYRLFSTGTIEEKIYQRQICKDGLSSMIVTEGENQLKDSLSADAIKDLFQLRQNTLCDTHDMLQCQRCISDSQKRHCQGITENGHKLKGDMCLAPFVPQLTQGFDEDDLLTWAHHTNMATVADTGLQAACDPSSEIFEKFIGISGVEQNNVDPVQKETFSPVSFVMSCRIDFNQEKNALEQESKPVNQFLLSDMKQPVAKKLSDGGYSNKVQKKNMPSDSEESEESVSIEDEFESDSTEEVDKSSVATEMESDSESLI